MPKPTPGSQYTVISGDTLSRIALRAYGVASKWRIIWAANETVLRSGDPDLIFPGEVILIPGDPTVDGILDDQRPELPGKDPDQFTLLIEDQELPVVSAKVTLTADTGANGWTATRALDPGDGFTVEFLRPYSYARAKVFLGGVLVDTGFLFHTVSEESAGGIRLELHGFTKTANALDSVVKSPFQASNVTLKQRAESMLEGRDVPLVFESQNDSIFKRVKAGKTEKIFQHLDKLAKQRTVLISCTKLGELLMYDPVTDGSIGTLEAGDGLIGDVKGEWDGRKRFNCYLGYGKGPRKNRKAVSKDNGVPVSRMTAFEADDTTDGDIQKAADYYRNKQIAGALSIPVPVTSWYGPNGKLWTPNTLITVKSDALFLFDGFTFMIRSVEFNFDSNRADATLMLVPPTVFTKGDLVDPWEIV